MKQVSGISTFRDGRQSVTIFTENGNRLHIPPTCWRDHPEDAEQHTLGLEFDPGAYWLLTVGPKPNVPGQVVSLERISITPDGSDTSPIANAAAAYAKTEGRAALARVTAAPASVASWFSNALREAAPA